MISDGFSIGPLFYHCLQAHPSPKRCQSQFFATGKELWRSGRVTWQSTRASAEFLADSVEHYTFISSLNAYAQLNVDGIDETYPVGTLPDETVEEVTSTSYGPLKALCEQAAQHLLPGRVLIIRPGLIVGPADPTGRFTYYMLPGSSCGTVIK